MCVCVCFSFFAAVYTVVVITMTNYLPCARGKIMKENLICCLPKGNVKYHFKLS